MKDLAMKDKKPRVPVAVIPMPLKLRPAARRLHLLEMMRARVPLDRAPPKTS
jgi:hypothetical protein